MNQRISTNLAVGFCALLLFAEVAFAQNKNLTVWPYGGVPDTSRQILGMERTPLNFNKRADFSNSTFDGVAEFGMATFDDVANFSGAKFDRRAQFFSTKFSGVANFRRATFNRIANFSGAKFDDVTYFIGAKFVDGAYFTLGAKFDTMAYFNRATFDGEAEFIGAKFKGEADFSRATFDDEAEFFRANFDSVANFFWTTFDSVAHFGMATFDIRANFVHTHFKETVNFSRTHFRQGVDFRQTYFDSVDTIYLENIVFPEGKLHFYWHQFQGKDSFRIKLESPPEDSLKNVHYTRIEIIYHRLRDNFLAQSDNASADAVMYELGWQKEEILGEFWWTMYSWLFGWGYQPWRFLLFVVAPLIVIFAGIWYWFYYGILIFINPNLSPQITTENSLGQKEKYLINFKSVKRIKIRFNDFSSLKGNINRLTRYWHAILFSAGVLLGIRFKDKWTQACPHDILGRKTFIYFVTLEWLLGIGLIVTFALLAKGTRFGFIRDLLGF